MTPKENLSCVLTFVIVGGSIAGLSTAYFMTQSGHKVIILEKQDKQYFLTQKSTGLRISPNLTLLLHEIPGMDGLLSKKGIPSTGFALHQGETFELIGQMIYSKNIISDLGSIGYRISYIDIWRHLYNLCASHSIEIMFGFEVDQVVCGVDSIDQTKVLSTLKQEIDCDMVIAADGHNSFAHRIILSESDDDVSIEDDVEISHFPELDNWNTCRLSIPTKVMQEDPDFSILLQSPWWMTWMCNGCAYAGGLEGIDQYGLNIYYAKKGHSTSCNVGWDLQKCKPMSVEEINSIKREPCLQKLLKLANFCSSTSQNPIKFSSYTDVTNHLVLVGDAAHAALVNGFYNTSLAVEDAFVLGSLFSKIKSARQIPHILTGYNDLRKKRAKMIRNVELGVMNMWTLAPGPQRDARNQALSQTLCVDDHVDDVVLAQLWHDHISTCSYNAKDAVEEWWHNWGTFM
ncbi:FAD/NAD(P)-binding domain-containing protein [Dendrothele bispora CBS 962.96]|uniref:FAD/NAD(P)-binding domain-containing protein n=1 Tax=Dendrothele bispora (strain CBS 962.96) TaxID=1314807 RepID=A0A4S8MTG1_DENBC|nr:FAD/NAD(P)-binding domain-containing protein [Dendrothele bispora CBS 962.96]